ncbi:MAG: hypothetical protein JWR51_4720 [Devosia sp.]|uniref:hypothetical protein n=1 Tax=Devosia sp. TaxID=1871048 RepID=UPI002615F80D|nr:hypothetical protein [Devosia sp.]MDB5531617.1 hypothetical protein [Devosia sp.]
MNWNIDPAILAQMAAQQAHIRQVEEANRQRAYLALAPWSAVAVEAYRGVVIEGDARRKAADEGRMGE